MAAWARDQCCQSLDEGERIEGDGGGSVSPVSSQAVDDLAVGSEREALGGQWWASDVSAQLLEPLALVGLDEDLGVQREAVDVAAQLAGDRQGLDLPAAAGP